VKKKKENDNTKEKCIGNIFFVYTKDQNSIPDELIFFRGVLING
jgi:hypothetical protein